MVYFPLGDRIIARCDVEAFRNGTEQDEIDKNSSLQAGGTPSYRCRGDGVSGMNSRWRALTEPLCRGKWLRLTVGQPKKCINSHFIFV